MNRTLLLATAALAALAATAVIFPGAQAQGPAQFKDHFMSEWDANKDGKITLEEVKTRRGDVFTSFDANENGFLDDEELALMDEMRENQHADMGGERGPGKGMMAQGGQGKGQGFGKGMHAQGQGKGFGKGMHGEGRGPGRFQQVAEAGMHNRGMMDANGDGKISREEFTGMTGGWFLQLDANGDKVIDDSDF